jgi:hypothetical protein
MGHPAESEAGLVEVLHPTLRDETAKDGAPGSLWLGREEDRSRSLRDDNKKREMTTKTRCRLTRWDG